MGIKITITTETAAEAVQLVQDLASVMPGMQQSEIPAKTDVSTVEDPRRTKPETKKKEDPVKSDKPVHTEEPDTNEPEEEEDTGPVPTVVELRAKAQEVGKTPEDKKAIKALLDEFESKSISDVPENKRAAFMKRLEGLA
jgi:hypothetical protein